MGRRLLLVFLTLYLSSDRPSEGRMTQLAFLARVLLWTGEQTATATAPASAQQAATPPPLPRCDGPEHRQFDFWIGEWDVRPASQPNAPPMSNVITREDDGCVIRERWQGARMTGQSVNIYDRSRAKWHQTWVDSTGGLHEYWGSRRSDGAMAFGGERPPRQSNAARVPTKLTFFPLGEDKVRQLAEISNDGGKTWSVNYDLIYTRRKR